MKRRNMALLGVILPAVLAAGLFGAPARAQTVADYEAALAALPAAPTGQAAGGDACTPLINYAFVSIAEDDRVSAFPVIGGLLTLVGDDGNASSPTRARCEAAIKQTVIKFDGGLGEDIVPQPDLEDVEAPFKVGTTRGDVGDAYRPVTKRGAMSH